MGGAVDALVQQDLLDGGYLAPEGDEPIMNCLAGWEEFKIAYPEVVESIVPDQMQRELKLDDLTGHPDFVVRHGNTWGVLDLKCATAIRPSYFTQCAQYTEMIRLMDGLCYPSFIGIIRLDKKEAGRFEYVEIKDSNYIAYEVDVFKAYRVAWDHSMKNREALRKSLEDEAMGEGL